MTLTWTSASISPGRDWARSFVGLGSLGSDHPRPPTRQAGGFFISLSFLRGETSSRLWGTPWCRGCTATLGSCRKGVEMIVGNLELGSRSSGPDGRSM